MRSHGVLHIDTGSQSISGELPTQRIGANTVHPACLFEDVDAFEPSFFDIASGFPGE